MCVFFSVSESKPLCDIYLLRIVSDVIMLNKIYENENQMEAVSILCAENTNLK